MAVNLASEMQKLIDAVHGSSARGYVGADFLRARQVALDQYRDEQRMEKPDRVSKMLIVIAGIIGIGILQIGYGGLVLLPAAGRAARERLDQIESKLDTLLKGKSDGDSSGSIQDTPRPT